MTIKGLLKKAVGLLWNKKGNVEKSLKKTTEDCRVNITFNKVKRNG